MGELDEKATAEELASFVASGRTGRLENIIVNMWIEAKKFQ